MNILPVDRFLDRLEGVRESGPGRWCARCPAHDDGHPSLSIREVHDRVLVHCFAGCSIEDVLSSIGLTLTDLFNQPLSHHCPPTEGRIPASDRLAAIDHEVLVVCVVASRLAKGEKLSDEDRERLLTAARRIGEARDA